jgi:hypothetical protein
MIPGKTVIPFPRTSKVPHKGRRLICYDIGTDQTLEAQGKAHKFIEEHTQTFHLIECVGSRQESNRRGDDSGKHALHNLTAKSDD